jgi:hypothetical protein
MAQMAAKYKESKLGPPCANFQEITIESKPVLPLEESCPNTLTLTYHSALEWVFSTQSTSMYLRRILRLPQPYGF